MDRSRLAQGLGLATLLLVSRASAWNPNQGTRLHGELRHGAQGDVVWFPVNGWRDAQGRVFTKVEVRQGKLIPYRRGGAGETEADPMQLLNATVEARATDGITMVKYKVIRIDDPPGAPYADQPMAFQPGSTKYYTLVTEVPGAAPEPYCRAAPPVVVNGTPRHVDSDHGRQAVPVAEVWNKFGTQGAEAKHFTMACMSGAIGKCYRWGYQGWQGREAKKYVQACTRMAMADYCGDGHSHTVAGTPIQLYDRRAPAPINARTTPTDGMSFETAWTGFRGDVPPAISDWDDEIFEGGALCLSKKRWDTIPLAGQPLASGATALPPLPGSPKCPALANADPRVRMTKWPRKDAPVPTLYIVNQFCDYNAGGNVSHEALEGAGALLYNNSGFLDALLSEWTGTNQEHRTSSTFIDLGSLPGAPVNYPPTYPRPSRPLGTVFRVRPPESILRGRQVVPLRSYRHAGGDHVATAQPMTPQMALASGYSGGDIEGWIFACVQGSPPPPNVIPLYREYRPWTPGQREFVTTTLANAPVAPCVGVGLQGATPAEIGALQMEGHLPLLTDD